MKTARAHEVLSGCAGIPVVPRSARLAVAEGQAPREEGLAQLIARLTSEANVVALPPGSLTALSPAPPDSETFLCFLATSRPVNPLAPMG